MILQEVIMATFIWLMGAVLVAFAADIYYHRSGWGWFFLSLLISPILGALFLIAAGQRRDSLH